MAPIMLKSSISAMWLVEMGQNEATCVRPQHGADHAELVHHGQVTCRHWACQGKLRLGLSMALIMLNSYTWVR